MLPKDYLVYCLTGVHATDYSDASGMLLLDVEHKCWSRDMLALCGISESQMPRLYESFAPVGTLLPETAAALGLPQGVTVCAGAGDNAAAAVGTGTVSTGAAHADSRCNISLGTSGTIFISSEKFGVDATNGLHAFAHADGGWHLMGCMLSAASCNKWWQDAIIGTNDYKGEEAKIAPEMLGRNHVYFLPYLMGERSPRWNDKARGTFIGLTMNHSRAHILRSVMEGVALNLNVILETYRKNGATINSLITVGGGARNKAWLKILSEVMNIDIRLPDILEEATSMGAAITAGVGVGLYDDFNVIDRFLSITDEIKPSGENYEVYSRAKELFDDAYYTLAPFFEKM